MSAIFLYLNVLFLSSGKKGVEIRPAFTDPDSVDVWIFGSERRLCSIRFLGYGNTEVTLHTSVEVDGETKPSSDLSLSFGNFLLIVHDDENRQAQFFTDPDVYAFFAGGANAIRSLPPDSVLREALRLSVLKPANSFVVRKIGELLCDLAVDSCQEAARLLQESGVLRYDTNSFLRGLGFEQSEITPILDSVYNAATEGQE